MNSIYGLGYSYYGEVRLGHSFILILLYKVMGHTYEIMASFVPLGRFVPWDVLSFGTFCPWDVMSLGRFVPWDVFSGTFCPLDVCLGTLLYVHLLLTLGSQQPFLKTFAQAFKGTVS